ncbi:MAG: hypothetical protein ACJAW4_002827, partial [Paracoccaceae bacterium]
MTKHAAERPEFFPEGVIVAVLCPLPIDMALDYRAPAGGVSAGDL